jgi:NADPH:quinone reductase-like Zn-dependent oxidoreductase
MKAIVYTQYGSPDVLQLKEVEKPTPKDNEVLVKVHAASINAADNFIIKGEPFVVRLMMGGIFKPKKTIPGADVAGRVEAVGRNVTRFKPGDEVFGDLSGDGLGAYAGYVCASEKMLALKPANIPFESAAAVPLAGVTALQGLRNVGKIQAGQKVLINGAAGGVGTFAVQIAKALGAEVTGVCSTNKVELVRSIGADHVIDYQREDFTRNGRQYDVIFNIAAYRSFRDYQQSLSPQGIYIVAGGATKRIFEVMLLGWSARGSQTFTNLMANPNIDDLAFMKDLLEAGKVTPVIDRCYPLGETADALRYFQSGQVQGKVVITVSQ